MTAARPPDTLPRQLLANAASTGERVAMREKRRGIWQCRTWAAYGRDVRHLACGLARLGLGRGDRLAVMGDNRSALYDAILAAQCLGAVPLALYQDAIADEVRYVVEHSEAKLVVAEDQEQVDKLLGLAEGIGGVERIIVTDPRGTRGYGDRRLMIFADVVALGREADAADPARFDAEVAAGSPEDVAVISYTSGTTGRPKGAMLSHRSVLATSDSLLAYEPWREGAEELFAYLPLAWVGDSFVSLGLALRGRFTVNIPEEPETILRDLREVGPTIFVGPPRVWENLLRDVNVRMDDASWLKRRIHRTFMAVAVGVESARMERRRISTRRAVAYRLGEALLYGPLRDHLGMGRIRTAYAGGAALGVDALRVLRGIGINVKQVYGLTEAGVLVAVNADGDVVPEAVGRPLPGVEIAVSADGEVLVDSRALFSGYLNDPRASAAAMTADGWLRTGDAGYFDEDGRLFVLDRATDIARLVDGTSFAPQILENKLKFSPYIKEAVVIGSGRPFVAALVSIDAASVGKWADKRMLGYTGYADLAARPAVYDLVAGEIERVNGTLPPALRIRRFLCLHKEFDADDAEITRTRKLRRRLIAERYRDLIEALYDGVENARVRLQVTYEDGRMAETEADIPIRSLNGFASAPGHSPAPAVGVAAGGGDGR